MNAILLDTHVFVWYMNGDETLNKAARKMITIACHEHQAHLAAISLWEISMLEKKERIILEMPYAEWINQSLEHTHIHIAPLTPVIAAESCHLPGTFHEDPADRLIVATARIHGLTLITRDTRILSYGKSKHISSIKA